MEQVDAIPDQIPQKAGEMNSADLVVGILPELDQDNLDAIYDAFRALPGSPRVAILQANPATDHTARGAHGTDENSSVFFVPSLSIKPDTTSAPALSMSAVYQSVFSAGDKLGARGCCVVASKLETPTPAWASALMRPLLEENCDLVVPYYARHKFEGLLNSSIVSPLMRCLYGKRIHNPIGPDLGISQRLFQKMLRTSRNVGAGGNCAHPLLSLAPTALCDNMQISEVHLGARIYPPTDWMNVSSLVAQLLSPLFTDMERNAACWQRTRDSVSVKSEGEPARVSDDAGSVDITHLVESFQLGNRDLQEIWGLVLPPSTFVEIRKLSRLPVEQFHMSDALWVRVVFDFALAHRLRTISRDHLLKAMTPLYLAWVASYAHDIQAVDAQSLDQRLENLSMAYESGKPYLVSRWRWPDRFNP